MPKQPSKSQLAKRMDKAWSKAVRAKARGRCEVCGSMSAVQAHHYVSRSNRKLRWETYNGICVCAKHHMFGNESFHQNPEWGHFWMEEKRWDDLREINCKMYEIRKWTYEEMQEKLEELEKVAEKYNNC